MLTLSVFTDGSVGEQPKFIELATEPDDLDDTTAYRIVYQNRLSPEATHIQPIADPPAGHVWGWGSNFAYSVDARPDREEFHRHALGFVALPLFDLAVSTT